ncbi:MAG TPA: PAS domain S-box protein [Stellaceae bacterium]|nr:PAS domain S-box protein [Stellaceae bacterium]
MGWARLYGPFDWFVPAALRSDQDPHRRARMFIAHLLGTPLGFPIVAYLYWLDPGPESAAPAIGAMIGAFWLYPPLLRLTRQFIFLSLLSGQHLSWIVLFTAYHYGGVGSPFLAWMLAVPVAGFYYLERHSRSRMLLMVVLAAELFAYYWVHAAGYSAPSSIAPEALAGAGPLSIFCAASFIAMLSLNYAGMVAAQQAELEREIATRRDTADALRAAKEEAERLGTSFRLLFDDNPIPMCVYDVATLSFLEVNDAAIAQYGYSRAQFLAMTIAEIRPSEDAPRVRAALDAMSASFNHADIWRHRKADGTEILVTVLWHRLEFKGRQAAIVAAIDVTDQERAKAALRESEARLRQILDSAYDAFVSADAEGRVSAWNAEAEQLFGWRADEIIGANVADMIVPPRLRLRYLSELKAFIETGDTLGRRVELQALRRDGSEFPVEVSISKMAGKCGPVFNAFIHDITERHQREQALRDSEQRYRLLAENITDVISVLDLSGTRTYVSPSVRDVLGYDPAELVGKRMVDMPHPDDAPMAVAAVTALRRGDTATVTLRSRHRGGHYVWMETSLRLVHDPETRRPIEVLAVSRDVSARQALQEELAAAKLRAEQANRAKSEFLANMSHELRTPLNAIMGFGDLIEHERMGPIGDPRYIGYGHDIVESGKHLLELINEILDFAKVDAGRLALAEEHVHIRATIEACTRMLAERIERGRLALDVRIDPGVGMLLADGRRLKQVMLNLIINSIKFTKPGGKIGIAATLDAAGSIVLAVADTGIGIAPEHLESVLVPFGQVDSAFNRSVEGTGLGLPLSKRLIELHGGVLSIESRINHGTTVTIRLPAERVLKQVA